MKNCSLKLEFGDDVRFEAHGPEGLVALKSKEYMDFLHKMTGKTEAEKNVPAPAAMAAPAGGALAPGQIVPLWPSVRQETDTEPVDWDIVAIYDNAGLPSIMHRFRRVSNKELFGGSDKPHPAFVIGGEVYDEIFISVYENCEIDGKPYSLPYRNPWTSVELDEFADACFDKGEGWHCLTAAEWGLLANLCAMNKVYPHGNTKDGKWNGDENEHGVWADSDRDVTLTGSGPATWTHDQTPSGVHDLCGNIWEMTRGARMMNGALQAAENNDAAMPETDLSRNGSGWKPVTDNEGKPIYCDCKDGVRFTTDGDSAGSWNGEPWVNVKLGCESEQMKELAYYNGGESLDVRCYVDATEGEYCPFRGGDWNYGGDAGVFVLALAYPRSNTWDYGGGRCAFYKKH